MFVFDKDNWQFIADKHSLEMVWYASNPVNEADCISTVMASVGGEAYIMIGDTEEELVSQIRMKNNESFITNQMTWQTLGSMFRFVFYKDKPRFFAGGKDFRASSILTCPGGEVIPDIYSFITVAQYEDGSYCMHDKAVVAETNPYDLLAVIGHLGLNDKIDNIISMPMMQAAPMFERIWHDDRVHDLGNRLVWDPKCIDIVFNGNDPEDMEERLLKKLKETEK